MCSLYLTLKPIYDIKKFTSSASHSPTPIPPVFPPKSGDNTGTNKLICFPQRIKQNHFKNNLCFVQWMYMHMHTNVAVITLLPIVTH